MKHAISLALAVVIFVAPAIGQDPGWPRQMTQQGATLVYYQPQVDNWRDFKVVDFRMAASLTAPGSKAAVGVITLNAQTAVNVDSRTVTLSDFKISKTSFPSLDPPTAQKMDQLVRTFLTTGKTVQVSLDRLVASTDKPATAPTVALKNDPPKIIVSYGNAVLATTDGDPVLGDIKNTKLRFVVNTNWPIILDKSQSKYYLFTGRQWMTSAQVAGPWSYTGKLPKEMSKLAKEKEWAELAKQIPPPASAATAPVPTVFYSSTPAEMILFKGQPVYEKIQDTNLVYATNTDSDVFVDSTSRKFYYLASGRWFTAPTLDGPWTYSTPELPADFARIPPNSPAGRVLASVPGTDEAKDAVLLAQVPTTVEVNPTQAAAQAKITYTGSPEFKPIEGTSLKYATNTADKVIQVGDVYYLCLQGVWFLSANPQGPWKTAASVPKEIYTIPPSSPVYNVTYVTQTTTSSGSVESSYTAGYLGTFILGVTVGAIVAGGTGYYYPPYIGYGYGYPIYRPYMPTYGYGAYYHGAYGASRGVYGPYGGARASAGYNPYTGTYARGATAYGPYGSRSAGQAYNPYTGGYAATRQGSSPYGSWGSSVATRGNQAVATQHVSNARGTAGAIQTSEGGRAVAASGRYGSGYAGKAGNGDMYAGRDGNVYKNTGGSWQKYDDGTWNSVDKPTPQPRPTTQSGTPGAQTRQAASNSAAARSSQSGAGAPSPELKQEFQNRQRGSAQSARFSESQRAGGGWGGSRSGGGVRRSGGTRRR
jgi:hypothetical protein